MKTFPGFYIIGFLFAENAIVYANETISSNRLVSANQQLDKIAVKVSERKILKQPNASKQEEGEVSSFSMEELRVGAQRILDESEIQYFKSQCRYAFMSDKEIIENRCETKKVSFPK
ncbi:hypothetical protein PTQ27_01965 [Mannheimia sp. AT1]|uniref:Uncharacterized protein n=1 Tax=Mannheimia cairinae TaxID=3025936 RepID=A0ABT5MM31_9PAST|nr:hypothetical protein [Mannheimia cairinae]MDD0823242.1 hypothetical protein [Mannheimia cairinae]MDD0825732.1 hypothetical protein [Mannheimia cairinae]